MRYVNKNKRQFIAGAICPKCKSQDTLVLITQDGDESVECVSCDHTEVRPTAEQLQAQQSQAVDVTNDIQAVKFKP